jgi:hypothetical protein
VEETRALETGAVCAQSGMARTANINNKPSVGKGFFTELSSGWHFFGAHISPQQA